MGRPTCWRVLREPEMRPVLMVVEQVRRHQPFEVPLIQDDHVIQQVASATAVPATADGEPGFRGRGPRGNGKR